MHNEFAAVIEEDGEWFIGYCPEIPGANGQGRTVEECRANLSAAIALILEDRSEDGLRGVPQDYLFIRRFKSLRKRMIANPNRLTTCL